MKDSEIYLRAAEEGVDGFAYSFLLEGYRRQFEEFNWMFAPRSFASCDTRVLALLFMAAIAESDGR